jgi:putative sigma-54 modulation protein
MEVTVTTRHMDDQSKAENLRNYFVKKIKRVERYIKAKRNPSEVKLILAVEKFRNIAEILINSGTFKVTSSVEAEDMYTAIDRAINSTIKQLKKQTDKKIKTKRRGSGKSKEEIINIEPESLNVIRKEKIDNIGFEKVPSKPMSVEEAILQLNVSEVDFLTFRNSETGEINTLYKRRGGNIVLIAP